MDIQPQERALQAVSVQTATNVITEAVVLYHIAPLEYRHMHDANITAIRVAHHDVPEVLFV